MLDTVSVSDASLEGIAADMLNLQGIIRRCGGDANNQAPALASMLLLKVWYLCPQITTLNVLARLRAPGTAVP